MIMFDSLIQLRQSLIEVDNRIPVFGWIYRWIFLQVIKYKLHKLKNIPVSANLILGFYKFALDTGANMTNLKKYVILYSPSNEREWMRTIIIKNNESKEEVKLTVYNGDMINAQYSDGSILYDMTVESHLLNFESTPDRKYVLRKSNAIFIDCILLYIDLYLKLKGG